MIRINSPNLDCKKPRYDSTQAFTAQNQTTTQVTSLPDIKPSYNVSTPISYQKTGEIELPYENKAHYYKLSNGQRVVILPKEGETVVKTYINTGSMNEPDKIRGISHYIEHNLFNGSKDLEPGEFFKNVDKMGAETNASTGFAETNYYVSSNMLNKEDLEKKIKIQSAMIKSPLFATKMLEKEKSIINSEINMILGYPETITANATLKKLYNIESTSSDLIGGSTNNITNLTREDVIDYYNNNYYPANMVTVITGEIEPEETMRLMSKYFNAPNKVSHERKHEKLNPIEKTIRQDLISDKTTATHITLGFNGPKNNDIKNRIVLDAIQELLTSSKTSRISKKIRPYSTNASIQVEKISTKTDEPRAIFINTETTESNSEKVLQSIFNGINSIQTNPPTDEEIACVKKSLIKNYSNLFEVSHSINGALGDSMLDGEPSILTDYEKIINSLTKDDLVKTAQKFLNLDKAVITVLHPQIANKDSILNQYKNAVSFGGSIKKQAINPENTKKYTLANNFNIVTNTTKTDNSCFTISYETETDIKTNPATRYILQGIINEGSKFKNDVEFTDELNKDGIIMDYSSGQSHLSVDASFAPEDLRKALKSAKEVIQTPRFNQETLDSVKRDIRDTFSRSEKSANSKLNKEILSNTSIGYTKEDILNSLDAVTLNDVEKLYNHIISTSQAKVAVSAPFNRKPELKKILFDEINKMNKVQPQKSVLKDNFIAVTETKILTDINDKNQAEIIEAFKFKDNNNIKDVVTTNLLNIILGGNASSRLFTDLREKQQLAYRVSSSVNYIDNIGLMKLKIATTTENKETNEVSYNNVQKSIEGFNDNINKLKSEKVTNEELESAKMNMKNTILSSVETNYGKNISLETNMNSPYGALYENQVLELIDKISKDDIYNAANYIFSNKPTYSILATENTLKANEQYFKNIT